MGSPPARFTCSGRRSTVSTSLRSISGTRTCDLIYGNDVANSLQGGGGDDTLYAFDGNDLITGGSGNDYVEGGIGNNTLDGGFGNDTLIGGGGNDTFVVDSGSDVVTENPGEGTDLVKAGVSWTLGANFENLLLTGSAHTVGTGNELNNRITGNTGDNDSLFMWTVDASLEVAGLSVYGAFVMAHPEWEDGGESQAWGGWSP